MLLPTLGSSLLFLASTRFWSLGCLSAHDAWAMWSWIRPNRTRESVARPMRRPDSTILGPLPFLRLVHREIKECASPSSPLRSSSVAPARSRDRAPRPKQPNRHLIPGVRSTVLAGRVENQSPIRMAPIPMGKQIWSAPRCHGGRRVRQPSIVLAERRSSFVKREARLQARYRVLRPTYFEVQ